MFTRASIAYLSIALAGVAVLCLFIDDGGTVPLSELDEHSGETVRVEGLIVAVDGDRTVLWDDGITVDAYGENPYGPGDRVAVSGYVSTGRSTYLNADSFTLLGPRDALRVQEAAGGSWVTCSGTLVVQGDRLFMRDGAVDIPIELYIDIAPAHGLEITLEGVFHRGTVHVYDRSGISSDDVHTAPWAVVGTVTLQGIVEFEPSANALTLCTLDGSIRVICNTTLIHMNDLIEVAGNLEYDESYARFVIQGECVLLLSNGPVSVTSEDLFEYPWKFEDATISLYGNVTGSNDTRAVTTPDGVLPLIGGHVSGLGYVTGILRLDDDLRYIIEAG
jgi:hypothetical protein